MLKIYSSNSCVSINVIVNGSNVHLTFSPKSNGSSMFLTHDKELQDAIESHYRFGSLFNLTYEEKESKANDLNEKPSAEESTKQTRKVTVSDLGVAKDYLSDKFGVSRTLMRSAKSIMDYAAMHGVEFVIENE